MCNKKSFGDLLKIIATEPVKERDIQDSRMFFLQLHRKEGTLKSVWSGKTITHVDEKVFDHMIPFSVWKNNELWNILPALKTENQTKSDFISHPDLLVRQKDLIIWYWNKMNEYDPDVFMEQIRYSLVGKDGRNRPLPVSTKNANIYLMCWDIHHGASHDLPVLQSRRG
jgi:CRISPR/Cas system Type II protein with McrA/HNH and RuvC-like nuclease domain